MSSDERITDEFEKVLKTAQSIHICGRTQEDKGKYQ
jgi:hypothetical protein